MRTAHISVLNGRYMVDIFDETGARVSGCYGSSDQVDAFVASQTDETRVMMDERRLGDELREV